MLGGHTLGGSVLEIGPGPGRSTDVLRAHVKRLTVVEAERRAAAALQRRFADTNVTVVHGDGTDLPFRRGRFSAVVAMTMLHHVPTPQAQDALLAEARRVLRSGGRLYGVDSLDSPGFRGFHAGDTCVPVDPDGLPARLVAAGFRRPDVERDEDMLRFTAEVPSRGSR